jgi:excisionase family DNA binding protein
MHRRLQLDTRENTASSGQHASRLAVGCGSNATCIEEESPQTPGLVEQVRRAAAGFGTSLHALPQYAATGEEREQKSQLLTVHEVAELLQVPTSWVYERTRRGDSNQLPHLKLGKYLRFEQATVAEFIRRQRRA